MKNALKTVVTLLIILSAAFSLAACQPETEVPADDLWANAEYTADITLGEGARTLIIKVEAEGRAVTLTVKTDKETVGAALLEHSVIAGDESEYGLYIKAVNGIKADYDTDGAYWSFNKNGEYMMTGVDSTYFADGEQYELVYTKG